MLFCGWYLPHRGTVFVVIEFKVFSFSSVWSYVFGQSHLHILTITPAFKPARAGTDGPGPTKISAPALARNFGQSVVYDL